MPLRGGWDGEGFPGLEGPSGAQRIRGSVPSVSPAQLSPGKPAGLPGQVSHPPRPSLGCVGPRGVGGGGGRRAEVDGEEPSKIGGSGEAWRAFPPPTQAPGNLLGSQAWSSILWGPLKPHGS